MKVLLVEDEPALAEVLSRGLKEAGYQVDLSSNGIDAAQRATGNFYDAIVLDLMLPGQDGLMVCRAVREGKFGTPVLMLTARAGLAEKIAGFDSGADDYMTKPFDFPELLVRLRSLLRRAHAGRSRVLRVADLELDTESRQARRSDTALDLTGKEYALLEFFMYHPGHVLSRSQILARVWPTDYAGLSNVVDVFVSYLRRKVDDPYAEKLIRTVPGVGYSLRNPESG